MKICKNWQSFPCLYYNLNIMSHRHNTDNIWIENHQLGEEGVGAKGLTYHFLSLSAFFQYNNKVSDIWSIVINQERLCSVSAIVSWTKVNCLYIFFCVQGQQLQGSLNYIANNLKSCWRLSFKFNSTKEQHCKTVWSIYCVWQKINMSVTDFDHYLYT